MTSQNVPENVPQNTSRDQSRSAPGEAGHRVVVLGAGYTGMMAAVRLARRTRRRRVRVTLVNPSSRFAERLRMHQIGTGQPLADVEIPDLLAGTSVRFVPGWATDIDLEARAVTVAADAGETRLEFDHLVYALGSAVNTTSVAGVEVNAFTLNSPRDATALARRLAAASDGAPVVVCGTGLTGIEAATEIAESHPKLRVMLLGRDEPGTMMGAQARAYLHRALEQLGVEVRSGAEVVEVRPEEVVLADGERVGCAVCLWTTGFWASPLAGRSGLDVDERGRIVVDATLRSVSHPAVFAVGDAAAVRQGWGVIHGTCQSGIPTAAHAADNLARLLAGRRPRPFRFGYIHQPVSLGRRDAVIQFTRADDSPRRWYLTGKAAVVYKELVTSSPPITYRLSAKVTLPARLLASKGGRMTRHPAAGPLAALVRELA